MRWWRGPIEASLDGIGAIRSRVNNGEERVYHAGEHWTEKPGVHHTVSENASATEPAVIAAVANACAGDGLHEVCTA